MGKSQRDKGARFEREIVNKLKDQLIPAERVPLSGACGGKFKDDIYAEIPSLKEEQWSFECKKRGDGFKQIYDWIDGSDGLFISADRKETLVVLSFNQFCRLARGRVNAGS